MKKSQFLIGFRNIIWVILIGTLLVSTQVSAATYTNQYPPDYTSTYVNATSYVGTTYAPWLSFNPASSLIGVWENAAWVTTASITNQKINVDLGSSKNITRIDYINGGYGAGTGWSEKDSGINHFQLYGTNDASAFLNLDYANTTGLTLLTTSTNFLQQHGPYNFADWQNFTVSSLTPYRYYSFRISNNYGDTSVLSVRAIRMQTTDPIASFSLSNTSGTAPVLVTITNTSTNTYPVINNWNYTAYNTGNSTEFVLSNGTTQNPTITFNYAGNYSVMLNVSNGISYNKTNVYAPNSFVNVTSAYTVPIAQSTLSRLVIQAGSYTWFNDTSLNTPTAWNWSFGDGTYAATGNGSKTFWKRGQFNVTSRVTNGAGSNTSFNFIRVI